VSRWLQAAHLATGRSGASRKTCSASTEGKVSGITRSLPHCVQSSIAVEIVAGRGYPRPSASGPSIDRLGRAYAAAKGRAGSESLLPGEGRTIPLALSGFSPDPQRERPRHDPEDLFRKE
jgi:hypothetical protein